MSHPMGRILGLAAGISMVAVPLMAQQDLQLKERAAAPQQAAKGRSNLLSTGCNYRPPPGTRYVELDSRGCPIAPADAGAGGAPPHPTVVNPQITPQTILPQTTMPTGQPTPSGTAGYYPYPYPVNPPEGLPPDWTPLPQPNTTTTITKNPDGSSSTTTTPVAPPGWALPPPAGWQSMPAPVNRWYGSGGSGTDTATTGASGVTTPSAATPSADGAGVLPPYPPYPPYPVDPPQGLPPGWTPLPQPNTTTTITKGPDGSSSTTTTPVAPPGWAPPPPAGWQSMPAPVNRWYGSKK